MVLKSDGSTAYATRDLAPAIIRYKPIILQEPLRHSAGQSLHLAQVFKVLH